MSDAGPDPVTVDPPRKNRWLRRELWFVLASVLAVVLVMLAVRHNSGRHVAPGVPYGSVPTPIPLAPVARPLNPAP